MAQNTTRLRGNVLMGIGARAAIGSSPSGLVIAAFPKAAYVRFPGGIVAVTASSVPPGPLHVISSVDPAHLAAGNVFVVPPDWVDKATVWRGGLPDPASMTADRPAAAQRALAALAPLAEHSALLAQPLVHRWNEAAACDDLEGACRLLGGLGPGLTPSGDDALAGMFLAARARWPSAENHLLALAAQVDTHEIARAFLIWAARGQSIEPVHRLLAGDTTAAPALRAYGHTSGADLALGLACGLEHDLAVVPTQAGTAVTRTV